MQPPAFLEGSDYRLLLFGGKGGAGKTTCAAATAWRLAERFPGRSFLLLSTDRKSTRLNSSHSRASRMPSSA